MGWFHPDISLENLVDRIKGFVDILVLATGYQSSGLPAIWDVDNIKKAVKWDLFFEHVLKSLRLYGHYEESVKELDAVLFSLTSDPIFPLGLAHMSSATLCNARRFVLEHLLQTHPIKDEHLVALLRAVVEMDIDELSESCNDCPKVYIDRLTLQMDSLDINASKCLNQIAENLDESRGGIGADTSFFVVKEILIRQAVMSRTSLIEKGLNDLSKIITGNKMDFENLKLLLKSADGTSSNGDRTLMELNQFNLWRSRCHSYLFDKRTIKLLSGSELIFQAPKEQWIRIFEGLMSLVNPCYDNVLEIVEILLLGLISSKWNILIQKLILLSCDFLPTPKKLSDLHEFIQRNTSVLHSSKENDILEYLASLLRSHPSNLWKLPSVLVAAAIPSWSVLFRMHLSDVEKHYNESHVATRCHACNQPGSKHQDCHISDRIQSLYTFHILCPLAKG